jgi:hypothetical protein
MVSRSNGILIAMEFLLEVLYHITWRTFSLSSFYVFPHMSCPYKATSDDHVSTTSFWVLNLYSCSNIYMFCFSMIKCALQSFLHTLPCLQLMFLIKLYSFILVTGFTTFFRIYMITNGCFTSISWTHYNC